LSLSLSLFESSLDCVGLAAATVDDPVAEAAFLWMQLVATAPPFPLPELPGAAFTSGLTLLPPLAFAKFHEKAACPVCSLIEADWSSEFFGPLDGWNA
jgi:hypothetical protein